MGNEFWLKKWSEKWAPPLSLCNWWKNRKNMQIFHVNSHILWKKWDLYKVDIEFILEISFPHFPERYSNDLVFANAMPLFGPTGPWLIGGLQRLCKDLRAKGCKFVLAADLCNWLVGWCLNPWKPTHLKNLIAKFYSKSSYPKLVWKWKKMFPKNHHPYHHIQNSHHQWYLETIEKSVNGGSSASAIFAPSCQRNSAAPELVWGAKRTR